MKDEKTRRSFVDELDEYIREVGEILTQPEQDLNNSLSYYMLYDVIQCRSSRQESRSVKVQGILENVRKYWNFVSNVE